jgi:hypothetical protein
VKTAVVELEASSIASSELRHAEFQRMESLFSPA